MGKFLVLIDDFGNPAHRTALEISHQIATSSLTTYIKLIKSRLPPHMQVCLLIYGLQTLYSQFTSQANARYRADVRTLEGEEVVPLRKERQLGIGEGQADQNTIEVELMRAQIEERCFIVLVEKEEQAVDWLEQFTLDVGFKPY